MYPEYINGRTAFVCKLPVAGRSGIVGGTTWQRHATGTLPAMRDKRALHNLYQNAWPLGPGSPDRFPRGPHLGGSVLPAGARGHPVRWRARVAAHTQPPCTHTVGMVHSSFLIWHVVLYLPN